MSLVDFVAQTKNKVTAEAVNGALSQAAAGELKGILRCENEPLVSTDFNGDSHSSIIDMPSTMVMSDNMVKVFSWYDNEMGFSHRMVDFVHYMAEKGL